MKTIVLERDALFQRAADDIALFLKEHPAAVITMAAGRTMEPLWECLVQMVRDGKLSFEHVTLFQTAEFIDAPEEMTLRHRTEQLFLEKTDLKPENCHWLTESNYGSFDDRIREAGGLDLAILGIGRNAHIAFNEPATQYDTRCRIQKLTDKTREQYAWLFGSADAVPEKACTMGIHTLIDAKKIMVLAAGEEKKQAVFDMLYARDDSVIPAAFLQLPFDVTVYADTEAGSKL